MFETAFTTGLGDAGSAAYARMFDSMRVRMQKEIENAIFAPTPAPAPAPPTWRDELSPNDRSVLALAEKNATSGYPVSAMNARLAARLDAAHARIAELEATVQEYEDAVALDDDGDWCDDDDEITAFQARPMVTIQVNVGDASRASDLCEQLTVLKAFGCL